MKKLKTDEIAFIIMIISIALTIIIIKIYSGSLYKHPASETSASSVIETTHKTMAKDNMGWLMVVATEQATDMDEPDIESPSATEAETKVYEIVTNIEAIVAPYDAKEDAQMQRIAATEPATAKATVPATTNKNTQVTSKQSTKEGFNANVLTYNGKDVVYNAKTSSDIISDVSQYLSGEKISICILENGSLKTLTGYAVAKEVTVFRAKEYVTKFLAVDDSTDSTTKATVEVTTEIPKTSTEITTEIQTDGIKENVTESATETTTEATTENKNEALTESTTKASTETIDYILYDLTPVYKEIHIDGWYEENGEQYYYYNEQEYAIGYTDIDSFKYYFDELGRLRSKTCIDVSVYQGTIDWNKVKASGIDYAIVRAGVRGYTYAKLNKDTMFDTNVSGALSAGLNVGAYIFSQAINETEAIEEASLIITMCQKYNINGPLIIDVEEVNSSKARQNNISVEERTKIINIFAKMVSEAGYTPMLYTGENWLLQKIDVSQINIPIWIAKWSDNVPNCNFSIWQYNPKKTVPGISTEVDVNLILM